MMRALEAERPWYDLQLCYLQAVGCQANGKISLTSNGNYNNTNLTGWCEGGSHLTNLPQSLEQSLHLEDHLTASTKK